MDDPWQDPVGGVVLGKIEEAQKLIRQTKKNPEGMQRALAAVARRSRPGWKEIIHAAERILGRPWREICERHGDWGRDAVVAVASRHLGWRLVEVAAELSGVRYDTLAQGVRRFWRQVPQRPEFAKFVKEIVANCQ